ncbi:interferon alpha/beta receptor 1-like isoform X1 [Ochotona curzoniae]|uniref:interferon alpha/beta receptor 1-like isoform X1 n=2 Tax=Ochotona curzoniae TaxID=130825 RepID=UPI001B353C30|nr:interferon alpha/beta receptor 1-like isoform X1 [Ochotona curzoniae]
MFPLLGATTLVLVVGTPWVSPAAADEHQLESPQHGQVYIIDDNFTLKWNRTNEIIPNVTFSADYQTSEMNDWIELPGCQYITATSCTFSLPNLNVFDDIKFRIRAERGNSTSAWHIVDSFIPFLKAQIGPPKVHLEAEYKAIIISITPPTGNMWLTVSPWFKYRVVIWKNSSSTENNNLTVYPRDTIYELSPATTYCLKVRAEHHRPRKLGIYSPIYCAMTKVEYKLPPPENVQVDVENHNYVLKWDYVLTNVTFQAQWRHAYLKWSPEDQSGEWKQIPGCENVRGTQCVFPQEVLPQRIIYSLRVRAMDGNNTSLWSKEKEFESQKQTTIPPPVLNVKTMGDALHAYVGPSQESTDLHGSLIYEIIYWENTSSTERKIRQEGNDFTFPDLKPLTLYCFKARALMREEPNQSSDFSDIICEKIKPGDMSRTLLLVTAVCAVLPVLLVVTLVAKRLLKSLCSVFFPSPKPPSSIAECLSEQYLENILLSPSEEKTEQCFVIEGATVIPREEGINNTNEDLKYSCQTSQDSGNYSNEDESRSKTSTDSLHLESG